MNTEHQTIASLVAGRIRSPLQLNRVHESDSELISLGGGRYLAITTDSIAEEIDTGLYRDPYEIGWMSVTACASDLAAVGATPLGIVMAQTLPDGYTSVERLALGIHEACTRYHLPLLGGDLNQGDSLCLTGTAVGTIDGQPVMRTGIHAGDALFASGPVGAGSVLALQRLTSPDAPGEPFAPVARIDLAPMILQWAGACMDSSDGLLVTLDELARLNRVGFRVQLDGALSNGAAACATLRALPPWVLCAGILGEYELVFTIAERRREDFLAAARATGWHPVRLGTAVRGNAIVVRGADGADGAVQIDTAGIRSIFEAFDGSVDDSIRRLVALAE